MEGLELEAGPLFESGRTIVVVQEVGEGPSPAIPDYKFGPAVPPSIYTTALEFPSLRDKSVSSNTPDCSVIHCL